MNKPSTPCAWTTAPDRHFQDYAVQNISWTAEHIHETFLRLGTQALSSSETGALQLPPLKGYAPKQAAKRKDLHQHRNVEIGIVVRGEMTIWWEGVMARCPAGTVFVIPPGIRYMPHVQGAEPSIPHSVIWLTIHRSYAVMHRCALEGNHHLLSEYYSFTSSLLMQQARTIAQELAERAPHYETVVRGSLLCLLTWLRRIPPQPLSQFHSTGVGERKEEKKGEKEEHDFSERVKIYLRSHYHRPITLAQIARAVGCSPAYLCRRFRELAGVTPFHFLRDVRLEAAQRLLQSEMPIGRIAEMVGFEDPLYFSKVFTKQMGESPQKYRTRTAMKKIKP